MFKNFGIRTFTFIFLSGAISWLVFSCSSNPTYKNSAKFQSHRNPSSASCEDHSWKHSNYPQSILTTEWTFNKIPLNVYSSTNAIGAKATVIYLHGFADTIQNHNQMFESLANAGYRVVGFDYPEHGPKGSASDSASANSWSMKNMAHVISFMLSKKNVDSESFLPIDTSKPVILMGWSTGATLALRIAQAPEFLKATGLTQLTAVVAIAPGIPVSANPTNEVKNENLTECPQDLLPPNPTAPWQAGAFAAWLGLESLALKKGQAGQVPTLVFIANSQKDNFVDVASSEKWVLANKERGIVGIQCDGKHGLEFEGHNVGVTVRNESIKFIHSILNGKNYQASASEKCNTL